MGFITCIHISILYGLLSTVCTKEENMTLKAHQVAQLGITLNRDIHRILLGVIILELIIIIILLGICIKIGDPKKNMMKNSDDNSSHSSHILPTFHLTNMREGERKQKDLFGYKSDQIPSLTSQGAFSKSSTRSKERVNTDENLLLQEELQVDTEPGGRDSIASNIGDRSSQVFTLGPYSGTGLYTGRGHVSADNIVFGSETRDSLSSKQRVKTLPRDFML